MLISDTDTLYNLSRVVCHVNVCAGGVGDSWLWPGSVMVIDHREGKPQVEDFLYLTLSFFICMCVCIHKYIYIYICTNKANTFVR